jgi:iron complex transport system substrate-binding protein
MNSHKALRIVSLVPSLTQTVCEWGLQESVVGCTSWCVDPPSLGRTATSCGGTKNPDLEKISSLDPTHVLVNTEENKPEHIAALKSRWPTLETFPKRPADVPEMLRQMGSFLGPVELAIRQAQQIEQLLKELHERPRLKRRALTLIWRDPWMACGPDTYMSSLLETVGITNCLPPDPLTRYPEVAPEKMNSLAADLILMTSEPWPFRKRDAAALRAIWPNSPEILWIDGQLLTWFGSKTASALEALRLWTTGKQESLIKPL